MKKLLQLIGALSIFWYPMLCAWILGILSCTTETCKFYKTEKELNEEIWKKYYKKD